MQYTFQQDDLMLEVAVNHVNRYGSGAPQTSVIIKWETSLAGDNDEINIGLNLTNNEVRLMLQDLKNTENPHCYYVEEDEDNSLGVIDVQWLPGDLYLWRVSGCEKIGETLPILQGFNRVLIALAVVLKQEDVNNLIATYEKEFGEL